MFKWSLLPGALMMGILLLATKLSAFEEDLFKTTQGDLKMTFIGHGTLMFSFDGKDHSHRSGRTLWGLRPAAQGRHHPGHSRAWRSPGSGAIGRLTKPTTEVHRHRKHVRKSSPNAVVMKNGDSRTCQGIKIEAVPAYNIVGIRSRNRSIPKETATVMSSRSPISASMSRGTREHPGNEPSLKHRHRLPADESALHDVARRWRLEAAKVVRPKVLYPYHYGDSDISKLVALLKDTPGIDVRSGT